MTSYRALAFRFSFEVDDEPLARHLAELFAALAEPHEPAAEVRCFTVRAVGSDDDQQVRFDLGLGDRSLRSARTAPQIVDTIVQAVNAECQSSSGWLSSHAAGVSRGGEAFVFPADPEAGKSTLAAGLVRAGFEYVSDEAVAFEWESGCIEPFPKPVSLDPGSWFLFPELDQRHRFPPGAELAQWQVPPGRIGPGRVSGPCRARAVVFLRYEAGAATWVTRVSRGEALVEWAKNTFRFNEQSRPALDFLSRLVREVDCYRMTVGDLGDAVAAVEALAES